MEITQRADNFRDLVILDIGYEIAKDSNGNEAATGFTELDIDNHFVFLEAVDALIDSGKTNILVNLANVSYIDSSGLGALFDGYRKAVAKNGQFKLCNANKDVKRVLEITKISKKIQVFDNEEDGKGSFNA